MLGFGARTLSALDWDALRACLAAETEGVAAGREALTVTPSADAAEVAWLLDLTEALDEALEGARAATGDLDEPDLLIRRTEQGGSLSGQELRQMARWAGLAEAWQARTRRFARLGAVLAARSLFWPDVARVRQIIEAVIAEDGTLEDGASPELGPMRREALEAGRAARRKAEGLARRHAEALGEDHVLLRHERWVLPIRADRRGEVPGLVIDRSMSGRTLHIEPPDLLEANEWWAAADAAVRREEARILEALCREVGRYGTALREATTLLIRMDLAQARVRLGWRWQGRRPDVGDAPELRDARHALLWLRLEEAAVPIDLHLGTGGLLITGPNTGGKTAALKTLGTTVLLHQSGILPPVGPGTRLPHLTGLHAEIGDPQSLDGDLSTFSGHVKALSRLLPDLRPGHLVLLDEVGSGTDPEEGAALARAILEAVLDSGAWVVATTHLGQLKTLPFEDNRLGLATTRFDLDRMEPRYRLSHGQPGASLGIAVAGRLGLPAHVLGRARALHDARQDTKDRLVAELDRARAEAEDHGRALAASRQKAEALQTELETRLAGWRQEERDLRRKARASLDTELDEARSQVREAIAILKGRPTGAQIQQAKERLEASARGRLAPPQPPPAVTPLETGQPVWLVRLERWGTVARAPDERGLLQADVGGLKLTVRLSEVASGPEKGVRPPAVLPKAPPPSQRKRTGGPIEAWDPPHAARTVDLRGKQVLEALPALERWLAAAWLAGHETGVVIHGHGTGALLQAVRQHLDGQPGVAGWRPGQSGEGGDGVTIVTFLS
ncbi:MAG: Smr/MutS family protein [Candidatus Sericytochromatia bacterium]|nr:Smr/MutS family protein [Candidatus Tanganyikabacteria bacterium]